MHFTLKSVPIGGVLFHLDLSTAAFCIVHIVDNLMYIWEIRTVMLGLNCPLVIIT